MNDHFLASDVKRIIFTDEKDFTLEMAKNHQKSRVYGQRKRDIHPSHLYYESSRFSRKVMVLAGVSWEGKTNIYFIDTCRAKVIDKSYIQLLDDNFSRIAGDFILEIISFFSKTGLRPLR